jgi:hypothetical protein
MPPIPPKKKKPEYIDIFNEVGSKFAPSSRVSDIPAPAPAADPAPAPTPAPDTDVFNNIGDSITSKKKGGTTDSLGTSTPSAPPPSGSEVPSPSTVKTLSKEKESRFEGLWAKGNVTEGLLPDELKELHQLEVEKYGKTITPRDSLVEETYNLSTLNGLIKPEGTFRNEVAKPVEDFVSQLKGKAKVENGIITIHDNSEVKGGKDLPDIKEAIDATVNQKIKRDRGVELGTPVSQYEKEASTKIVTDAYKRGDLVLSKDSSGKSVLKRGTGFLESFVNALNQTSYANAENNLFESLSKADKIKFLNQNKENPEAFNPTPESAPSGLSGAAGNFVGENSLMLSQGAVGAMVAPAVAPAALVTGASNVGSFVGLVNDFAKGGYRGGYEKTYYALKEQGFSDEEAADKADIVAHTGAATQTAAGAILSGSLHIPELKASEPAVNGFVEGIVKSAGNLLKKEAPKMAATSAGGSLVESGTEAAVGVDVDPNTALKEAIESGGHGAVIAAAFWGLHEPLRIPSYLRPHAENVGASIPVEAREAYLNKAVEQEIITEDDKVKISKTINEFGETKKPIEDLPIPEEKKAAITGKLIQAKKIQEEIDSLTPYGASFNDRIAQLNAQKEQIHADINGMYAAEDVFALERDSLTGEKPDAKGEPENTESAIADVERRRQEELDATDGVMNAHYKSSLNSEYNWKRVQAQEYLKDPKAFLEGNIEAAKKNLLKDKEDPIARSVIENSQKELELLNKINSKYDAELEAFKPNDESKPAEEGRSFKATTAENETAPQNQEEVVASTSEEPTKKDPAKNKVDDLKEGDEVLLDGEKVVFLRKQKSRKGNDEVAYKLKPKPLTTEEAYQHAAENVWARTRHEHGGRASIADIRKDYAGAVSTEASSLMAASVSGGGMEITVPLADFEKGIDTETKNKANESQAKTEEPVVQADEGTDIVYHGTKNDFEEFDPSFLGENTKANSAKEGFFFASNKDVAISYASESNRIYDELKTDAEKAEKELEDITDGHSPESYTSAKNRKYRMEYGDTPEEIKANNEKIEDIFDRINKFAKYKLEFDHEPVWNENDLAKGASLKEVKLKMKSPLIYDFKGNSYRDKTYTEIIKEAKDNGHDGVILKNTYDGGNPFGSSKLTDIHVVFDKSQIEYNNAKTKSTEKPEQQADEGTNVNNEPQSSEEGSSTQAAVVEGKPAASEEVKPTHRIVPVKSAKEIEKGDYVSWDGRRFRVAEKKGDKLTLENPKRLTNTVKDAVISDKEFGGKWVDEPAAETTKPAEAAVGQNQQGAEQEATTPVKNEYKSRIDNLDKESKQSDVSQLKEGDYVNVPRSEKSSGVTGFVKKVGRTNVVLDTFYQLGSTADDGIMQDITVKKSDIKEFIKPKNSKDASIQSEVPQQEVPKPSSEQEHARTSQEQNTTSTKAMIAIAISEARGQAEKESKQN